MNRTGRRRRCAYQPCGQMFVAERARRQYCTRSCSAKARRDARPGFYQAIGRKGGSTSGAVRNRTLETRLRAKLGPSATLADAYRLGKTTARRSDYGQGYRTGYGAGYDQALRDTTGRTGGRVA